MNVGMLTASVSVFKGCAMSNKRFIHWLYRELPVWEAEGLITAAQAERLRARYGEPAPETRTQWGMVVIAILGVLLIGGGIILMVAYNWEQLSRPWRTVLSILPLLLAQLIYGYAFFRRQYAPAWVEGASTFLFLMLGASLALISQTYHIAGTLDEYLLSWALLSIPLLYLMNASLPAVLYLIGIAWWAVERGGSTTVWYWGLLAAVLPHLIINLRADRSPLRRNVLGWALTLTFAVAWWWVIEVELTAFSLVGSALVLSLFYLIGKEYNRQPRRLIRAPFRTVAVAGMFVMLLVLSFRLDLPRHTFRELTNGLDFAPWAARTNLVVLVLLFGAYVYLFLRGFSRRGPIAYAVSLFPFVIIAYLFFYSPAAPRLAMALANLFAFGLGLIYLLTGIQRQRLGLVNIGLMFILVLAAVRFFDTDWSYIAKGTAFILLGAGFLAANWVLSRRWKETATS